MTEPLSKAEIAKDALQHTVEAGAETVASVSDDRHHRGARRRPRRWAASPPRCSRSATPRGRRVGPRSDATPRTDLAPTERTSIRLSRSGGRRARAR